MSSLRLDVWSDIVCPWCYVGKRRLELALERFPQRAEVELHWRSFELDPTAPREIETTLTHAEWLAKKYRMTPQTAEQRIAQLAELGRADGLDFRFDRLRRGNSFDAHRLLQLGKTKDLQEALKERFFRAYFSEGAAIGQKDVLSELAAEVGLDRDEVLETLDGDRFAAEVRSDEQRASALGIHGVPFFVLGNRYAVSGAQPVALLLSALERAYAELDPLSLVNGAVCGPDDPC